MSTRKLIVHIGNHKTGTTSIQSALFHGRQQLKSQGYSYFVPDIDGKHRQSRNANTCLSFKDREEIECTIEGDFASRLGELEGNVIVSAEHFSWVFSEDEIRRFRDQLKPSFDEFTIVAYVRRQDKQAVSHYQQGSEFNAFAATGFYDGDFRALPPYQEHFQKYLNYYEKMSRWANIFGDDKLLVRVFEDSEFIGGDVVTDFLTVTGLQVDIPQDRKNVSRGFEQTKLGHLMNRQKISRRMRNLLIKNVDSNPKPLPSRQEAENFYLHFRESNRELNERFKITASTYLFDENFDHYPEQASDQWSEELANNAILSLLEGINHLPVLKSGDLDLLRSCSRSLANIGSDQAEELLAVAGRLNPRGPGKKNLVAEQQNPLIEQKPRSLKKLLLRLGLWKD